MLRNINLNQLRVFQSVYRTKNMCVAAKELRLTQPGVSQHIKKLEQVLKTKLFDRMNKQLFATEKAKVLFQDLELHLKTLETTLTKVHGGTQTLSGTVNIGMPVEFGNNVIIPLLAKFQKEFPELHFQIKLDLAPVMNDALLAGELDFAFVDNFPMDARIKKQKAYDEILDLCIHKDFVKDLGASSLPNFEKLSFVEYQKGEALLRMWFAHHFYRKKVDLNVVVYVADAQSIARLILEKCGAGILPHHLSQKLVDDGASIHIFKTSKSELTNTISVAHLNGRTLSRAAQALLQNLNSAL